jgi:hypothetical protein
MNPEAEASAASKFSGVCNIRCLWNTKPVRRRGRMMGRVSCAPWHANGQSYGDGLPALWVTNREGFSAGDDVVRALALKSFLRDCFDKRLAFVSASPHALFVSTKGYKTGLVGADLSWTLHLGLLFIASIHELQAMMCCGRRALPLLLSIGDDSS